MKREITKEFYKGGKKKGRHPASVQQMSSGLHDETGCRNFSAGKVFE